MQIYDIKDLQKNMLKKDHLTNKTCSTIVFGLAFLPPLSPNYIPTITCSYLLPPDWNVPQFTLSNCLIKLSSKPEQQSLSVCSFTATIKYLIIQQGWAVRKW